MTCDEVRDLLSGYVLDALEPNEMDDVEEHLVACREHDEDLVDLRATGMALAYLDESQPSSHLRDRVRAATGPMPLHAAGGPLPLRAAHDLNDSRDIDDLDLFGELDDLDERPCSIAPPRSSMATIREHSWWFMGAAAAIALVMFGGGWYAGTQAAPNPTALVRYSYEMRGPGGQLVRFAGIEGSERVTVTMDGLQAQPDGQQYQVWAIRDGRWISLGHCNTNSRGWWKGDFEFTLRTAEEVALTVEPTGGSPKPSTAPLLRTKF